MTCHSQSSRLSSSVWIGSQSLILPNDDTRNRLMHKSFRFTHVASGTRWWANSEQQDMPHWSTVLKTINWKPAGEFFMCILIVLTSLHFWSLTAVATLNHSQQWAKLLLVRRKCWSPHALCYLTLLPNMYCQPCCFVWFNASPHKSVISSLFDTPQRKNKLGDVPNTELRCNNDWVVTLIKQKIKRKIEECSCSYRKAAWIKDRWKQQKWERQTLFLYSLNVQIGASLFLKIRNHLLS